MSEPADLDLDPALGAVRKRGGLALAMTVVTARTITTVEPSQLL